MAVDDIVTAINNAPLSDDVKEGAISAIEKQRATLGKMFESLEYKPPTAHPDWWNEITQRAMSIITPALREASVSGIDGTNTYAQIYCSMSGEDPAVYL